MPTYTNTGLDVVTVISPKTVIFQPGDVKEINFYLRSLPDSIEFTSHTPLVQPWVLLAEVSSAPSGDIEVNGYASILIYNTTEDTVSISVNGDDENPMDILSGVKESYNNTNGIFGIITVLEMSGTDPVKIWGTR